MCQRLLLLQVRRFIIDVRSSQVIKLFPCIVYPLYGFSPDVTVAVEGFGDVTVDVSYGGAFYAFVNAQRFGLDVSKSRTRDLVDAATAVTNAVKSQVRSLSCGADKKLNPFAEEGFVMVSQNTTDGLKDTNNKKI